jgi:hypothetical protein
VLDNYITWHFQMSTYLRGHNAYRLVDGTVVPPTQIIPIPNPTPTTDAPTTLSCKSRLPTLGSIRSTSTQRHHLHIKTISINLVDSNSHIVNKVMTAKKSTHDRHSTRKLRSCLITSLPCKR